MAFQKGNPGRPKGSKNKKLELFRSSDRKLQQKVLDMAMEGDPASIKIIADRLWPRIRAQAPPVTIDTESDQLTDKAGAAIDAALSGDITTDVLKDLLMAMYAHGRLIELTELEQRLQALEARDELPPWESRLKLPLRGKRRKRDE